MFLTDIENKFMVTRNWARENWKVVNYGCRASLGEGVDYNLLNLDCISEQFYNSVIILKFM